MGEFNFDKRVCWWQFKVDFFGDFEGFLGLAKCVKVLG